MKPILERLAETQLQLNELHASVTVLAVQARRLGYTWVEIGRALGISKQATQRRFSPYVIDPMQSPGDGA